MQNSCKFVQKIDRTHKFFRATFGFWAIWASFFVQSSCKFVQVLANSCKLTQIRAISPECYLGSWIAKSLFSDSGVESGRFMRNLGDFFCAIRFLARLELFRVNFQVFTRGGLENCLPRRTWATFQREQTLQHSLLGFWQKRPYGVASLFLASLSASFTCELRAPWILRRHWPIFLIENKSNSTRRADVTLLLLHCKPPSIALRQRAQKDMKSAKAKWTHRHTSRQGDNKEGMGCHKHGYVQSQRLKTSSKHTSLSQSKKAEMVDKTRKKTTLI